MVTSTSHSPADTAALGEQWGRAASSGLVIGLTGELGAGKTQFVKGLARGLGIPAGVHSPTFVLVNVYTGGRLTLFHLDLYRLDTPAQIAAAGLEEYLRPAGVTVIEWSERWLDPLQSTKPQVPIQPAPHPQALAPAHASRITHHALFKRVWIEILSETERRLTYEDPCP